MAGTHGGPRPGAGRTPKSEKYHGPIAAAERQVADKLPDVVAAQLALALGETTRTVRKYQAAGSIVRKDVVRDSAGLPIPDRHGRPTPVEVPMYPGRPADDLVLVETIATTPEPDHRAGAYLIDRILGKAAAEPIADAEALDIRAIVTEARSILAARKAARAEAGPHVDSALAG